MLMNAPPTGPSGFAHQPTVDTTVTITRLPGTSPVAFGIAADGESVFVPVKVCNAVNPTEGVTYKAKVVPSSMERGARWVAVRLDRTTDLIPQTDRGLRAALIADAAYDHVVSGGVWTVAELMHELFDDWSEATHKAEINAISNRLHAAHATGAIACASIRSRADQKRASRLLWAKSWSTFEDELFGDEDGDPAP